MHNFDAVMAYCKSNSMVFQEIVSALQNNPTKIAPFVGAGMSAFCYPCWGNFLESEIELINSPSSRDGFLARLNDPNSDYEQLASDIRSQLSASIFNAKLQQVFSPDKLDMSALKEQAVCLLPDLFKGLVFTTNYDQILERVYPKAYHGHPGHTELLNSAMRTGELAIYKFHGDLAEPEGTILAKEEYDKDYSPGSKLVSDLKKCYDNQICLFLGCSLRKDRTLDVLKDTLEPGVFHFAILDCDQDNLDTRLKELGEKRIHAILYPKEERKSVRIILERLLEILHPDKYQLLGYYAGRIDMTTNRFKYSSGYVPFIGRTQELYELEDFCLKGDEPVKWWAITGEGGSGKSRLAFEFKEKMLSKGWKITDLGHQSFADFKIRFAEITDNTLAIIDYVHECASDLGQWICDLSARKSSFKLRLLLIERDGKNVKDATWFQQMCLECRSREVLQNTCYDEQFLYLKPMEDNDIKSIMQDYGKYLQHAVSDENTQGLYEQLAVIDPELTRPLFALFLVDAWMNEEDALKWDRKDILDYITGREKQRIANNIKGIFPQAGKLLIDPCQRMQGAATVLGGLDIGKDIEAISQNDYVSILNEIKKSNNISEITELFLNSGFDVDFNNGRHILKPILPDLLGEYFVYKVLIEQTENIWGNYIKYIWRVSFFCIIFFIRLIIDFRDLMKNKYEIVEMIIKCGFDNADDAEKKRKLSVLIYDFTLLKCKDICMLAADKLCILYNQQSDNTQLIQLYADGLFNLSVKQDAEGRAKTAERLRELYEQHRDNADVAVRYAEVLLDLSGEQDVEGRAKTAERLQELYEQHQNNVDVALEYAYILFNLSVEQDAEGCAKIAERLHELYEQYRDNADVVVQYAKILFNLSVKQDAEGRAKTAERLQELHEQHRDNADVAARYAKVLLNLSLEQDAEGCAKTAERLQELYDQHRDNADVAVRYAKVLFKLSVEQDAESCAKTAERLRELYEQNLDNADVAAQYANILFNLSVEQDVESRAKAAERLRELHEQHRDNAEVAVPYVNILVNLSVKQGAEGRTKTAERLRELYEQRRDNIDVAVAYAKALFNLSLEQDAEGREKTAERLRELYEQHGDNADVAVAYAKALFNLSVEQDAEGCAKTAERLRKLCEQHGDNADVAVTYANILVNLSEEQDAEGCAKTAERLQELYEQHRDYADVAVPYAKILFNLCAKQDVEGRAKTSERLRELYEQHRDNADVAVQYARILFNLSLEQDAEGRAKTAERLQELYEQHRDNDNVAVAYANILFNLSVEQDGEGCAKTAERLLELYEQHRETADVAVRYAKILLKLSVKQDAEGREKTAERLRELYEQHRDNADVVVAYAKMLVNLCAKQDAEGCAKTAERLQELYERYTNNTEIARIYTEHLESI